MTKPSTTTTLTELATALGFDVDAICDMDGPDYNIATGPIHEAIAQLGIRPKPEPHCDECKRPKCECDLLRSNRGG